MYQRLLKVDPLKCILCGSQMRLTGLKRGYRLAELVMMHESLARCSVAAESRRGEVASILRGTEQKTTIHTLYQSVLSCLIVVSVHMVHKEC